MHPVREYHSILPSSHYNQPIQAQIQYSMPPRLSRIPQASTSASNLIARHQSLDHQLRLQRGKRSQKECMWLELVLLVFCHRAPGAGSGAWFSATSVPIPAGIADDGLGG